MRHREFVFYLVEADKDNAASLAREVDNFRASHAPWPETIKTHVVNEKFDVTTTAILDQLREQRANLAPTFAFIDPFGYSGMPMKLLVDLLAYPSTEVFVNFMVGHVQRFITRHGQETAMRELFGMDAAEVLGGYDGRADRIEYLRAVYARQLQERAGFDHMQSFAMINETGNIGYYLLHGTRHRAGVKLMKSAMWRVDPGGGCTFSDRLADEDVLFVLDPDLRPLRQELLRHYAGQRGISASDIEWHTLLHTPYREAHVRPVLRQLEAAGVIQVDRPAGKRQFAAGVTIEFPS
jgi:three-Cys-motif partner protein